MKSEAAKTARRKRRIGIMKVKRALCKSSAASTGYTFLSLPQSSINPSRNVVTASSMTQKISTRTNIATSTITSMPCRADPNLLQAKQQLNMKGLNKDEVRKQRNRLSAENSRQKKLAVENELRARIAILEKENSSLRQRVQRLEYDGDDSFDKIKKEPYGFDENVCNNIMMNIRHSSGFISAA